MSQARTTDAADLLLIARDVAQRAAKVAREMRDSAIHQVTTKSTATDVVTAADRAVERMVVEALHELRPGDTVLGEEYGATGATGTGVRWVLDPIDGTVNYLYGLAPYAVSLAAEVDAQVVAAVVHEAVSGEEWTASRGGGAFRAGRRLTGSSATELGQALIATGFAYDPGRRAHQAGVVAGLMPSIRDIRRFGAAAVDLCLAAEGRVDAYFEKGLNPWDHAAGGLIAREAGLVVTGLRSEAPGINFVLAAPPALYGPLRARLLALDADGGP